MFEISNIKGYDKSIILNRKTAEYCEGMGALYSVKDYCELIAKHFRCVEDIGVSLFSDPEIPNDQRVKFDVLIDDDNLDDILRREGGFVKEMHRAIPVEISEHFVLVTTIKYAKTKLIMASHTQE